MTSEATLNIPSKNSDTPEKSDTEKGKMSFVNVLLSGDDTTSKGTIVYSSSTSNNEKPPTDTDSSTTPHEKGPKGRFSNKRRNFKKNGGRNRNDHKISNVDDKVGQSMGGYSDEVFVDCDGGDVSNDGGIISPALTPNENPCFNRKKVQSRNSNIENEVKRHGTSESDYGFNSPTGVSGCVNNQEKKVEETTNMQSKNIKHTQEKQKTPRHHNNKNFDENQNRQLPPTDINDTNSSSTNIRNSEISSNLSNDTGDNHQSNDRNRKKVYSKSIKKNHIPYNGRNKRDDNHQGWRSNRGSTSSLRNKNINSQGSAVFQDYLNINETSVEDQGNGGNRNSGKRNKPYKGRKSREYSHNESDARNVGKQANAYKERGPLPSWDEADACAGNGTEDGEDYMGVLEKEFRNLVPYYTVPLFDETKATEVPSITYVSGECHVLSPKPILPYRPVTISTSIDTYKKSQPLTPITPPSMSHFTFSPQSPLGYGKPRYGCAMSVEQIKDCILRQIEYYLSEENLVKDAFMLSKISGDGYISLPLLAGFPKIRKLTADYNLVVEAMKSSTVLEMSMDCQFIRSRNYKNYWFINDRAIGGPEKMGNVGVKV
uniref:HTH La-type RNA-binding domain-containing protein n=1 Tax=Strongyloides papillosus TaxID=174720 RepID=A0A0N5CBL5_STREA